MIPAPGRVLLKPVEVEQSVGRIHLLPNTVDNWTPNQYEVVVCGLEAPCEDEDCDRLHFNRVHPRPYTTGDWVLVRHRCVTPTDTDNLFIAWQDDILAVLTAPVSESRFHSRSAPPAPRTPAAR